MSENENGTPVQGKQLGIAGFVLALVTLVLSSWIAVMATASVVLGGSAWLMYLWLVLALVSIVLSVMGMSKLKKSGGKKGLAVAGMVIGIVSSVWCLILVLGISAAASMADTVGSSDEWKDAMKDLEKYEETH